MHPFRVQILHGALEEQVAPSALPGLSAADGVTPRRQDVQSPFLNETRASPDPLSYMFTPPPQSCLKVDLNVKQSLSVSMGNKCISSVEERVCTGRQETHKSFLSALQLY